MAGGGQYINRLDDMFKKDILRKLLEGFGSEMDRSAYSLTSESSKRLASKMNRSVVSLASFNGFAKKFSCTGVFIKGKECSATILTSASLVRVPGSAHMIDDNLWIEVCLPGGFRVVGILNCYNLHYNVALVDIMGFWCPRTIKIHGHPVTSSMDVIAVGSLFARRKLMAVEGKVLIGKQSELDCKELCVSTCKITKAGIGGALIDNDGNFVGMNFYDEEETPFLPRDVIHRLLLNFNKKGLVQLILLSRVLKTDGCCLVGHTETLKLLQRLMETNGRCLSHASLVVETTLCHFTNGLCLVAGGLCLCDVMLVVELTITASIDDVFLSVGALSTSGINIAFSMTDSC